jgi:cold shock CspA family protein
MPTQDYMDQFLPTFIRSGAYPNSIFAHNSTVDPDLMSDLSIGRDINFRIRFNRAGAVALNIKVGRLP